MSTATTATLPFFRGLSHVAIACPDLAATLAFYQDVLGFTEHCRLNYAGTDRLMLVCLKINDRQWLELFDGANLPVGTPPLHQVALLTPDAEACRAALASRGYPVPDRVWQGQMRNFGFTTPDPREVTIEFVQPTRDSWMARDAGRFLPAGRIGTRIIDVGIAGALDAAAVQAFYGDTLDLEITATGRGWDVAAGEDEWIRLHRTATACWFTLAVPDLAAARTSLLAAGADLTATPDRLFLTDPAGMEIHVVTAPA